MLCFLDYASSFLFQNNASYCFHDSILFGHKDLIVLYVGVCVCNSVIVCMKSNWGLMLTYFYSKTTLKELRETITYVERYTENTLTVNMIVCILSTHFLCICIHITCTYYIKLYFFTQQHI